MTLQAHAVEGWQPPPNSYLHQLAARRMAQDRDLKIIITAEDSQTGVGKTTLAGWLALSWTPSFAGTQWSADEYATLDPKEYFDIIGEAQPGVVVVVDDCEELDARRAMQNLNVEFSQRWMLRRLKQLIAVLTLPSPAAVDSRLEELCDIWINVTGRGVALVHDIMVGSYGNRDVMTKKKEYLRFPDVSNHPELNTLRGMKRDKMDRWDGDAEEEETPDPEDVRREQLKKDAQRLRDEGLSGTKIGEILDKSHTWVYDHTEPADETEVSA